MSRICAFAILCSLVLGTELPKLISFDLKDTGADLDTEHPMVGDEYPHFIKMRRTQYGYSIDLDMGKPI